MAMVANTVPRALPNTAAHSGRPAKPQFGMAAVPTRMAACPGVSPRRRLTMRQMPVVTMNSASSRTNRMPACSTIFGSPSMEAPASMVQGSSSFMTKSDRNLLSRPVITPHFAPARPSSTSRKITAICPINTPNAIGSSKFCSAKPYSFR